MHTINKKQVGQLLVVFHFCRQLVNQLAIGKGISYNQEEMLEASNRLSLWIHVLQSALDDE